MNGFLAALASVAAVLATGCNSKAREVEEFFPLGVGHDWVYEVTKGNNEKSTLEFHIVDTAIGERGEKRFFLDEEKSQYYLQHGEVVGMSVSPDIWTVFLSGPLRIGTRFDGGLASDAPIVVYGETPEPTPDGAPTPRMIKVRSAGYKLVTALDRTITVPAGTFEDCIEVTHVAGPTTGIKYFAPGVGMVYAEAYFVSPSTKTRSLITRQELAYYRVGGRKGGTMPVPHGSPVDTPTPLVVTSNSMASP